MVVWIISRGMWILSRVLVTLICVLTVYNIINQITPYKVSFELLLIVAACVIIAVRAWMPSCPCQKDRKND